MPQSYLKRWTSEDGRVLTYRTLVSNSNVPKWEPLSPRGIAYYPNFYTRVVADGQTDEIEKWIDREYEAPAEPVLKKVVSESKLTPKDWTQLIKFLAVQDVRTPPRLLESLKWQNEHMPNLMQKTLEESVHIFEAAKKESCTEKRTNFPHSEFMPMRVSTIQNSRSEKAHVKVQSVSGRGVWLFSIKRMLTNCVSVLQGHKWTILKAPKGMSWCTSDNPVIKLNYYKKNPYDFKGGWGSDGTEIILPISPGHLMYTKIGTKPPQRGTVVSGRMAKMIQKFTAENAHRFIFSTEKNQLIERIRPRTENKDLFDDEAKQWERWHELNVNAERELYD